MSGRKKCVNGQVGRLMGGSFFFFFLLFECESYLHSFNTFLAMHGWLFLLFQGDLPGIRYEVSWAVSAVCHSSQRCFLAYKGLEEGKDCHITRSDRVRVYREGQDRDWTSLGLDLGSSFL